MKDSMPHTEDSVQEADLFLAPLETSILGERDKKQLDKWSPSTFVILTRE